MGDLNILKKIRPFFLEKWEGEKRVHGLKGGARAYFLSLIAQQKKGPLLIIAPSLREAEDLFCDLAFFLRENRDLSPLQKRLHLFPSWEILPFEKLSPHPDSVAARLEGLFILLEGKAPILVSTPAALMQKVIPKEELQGAYQYIVAGQEIDREKLLDHLTSWGFQNVPLVEERGDFGVRGGIIDLFPPSYEFPLRLELCDQRLESIRIFDPSTQRSKDDLQELLLLPMKEFALKRGLSPERKREIEKRAEELELGRTEKNSILDAVAEGIPFPGMEFLVPYFYPALTAAFSYFPPETLVWLDEAAHVETEVDRFDRLTWERGAKAREEGRFSPPVESLYLAGSDWRNAIARFQLVRGESLDVIPPEGKSPGAFLSLKSYLNIDLRSEIASHTSREPSLAPLANRLKEWDRETIYFVAPTKADANRLKELLAHYGAELALVDEIPLVEGNGAPLRAILVGELSQGFRLPDERLVFITSDEIFATKRRQGTSSRKTHPSHFITSLSELKQDNYVVHLDHGIGIYRGLKFLQVAGCEGEFLHLEYDGGDRLYLPVDRINLVQKYIGGDGAQPSLDRLGGTSWEKVKAKTRKSVLAMAEELVGLYAAREVYQGHTFSPPDPLYREFEASFDFEETEDQERAIEETLSDMQNRKPMDRLICGDVGYGKTEVAIRAAFLAVNDGKQVAVLVPTTILAEQHLQTFRRRFRNYPVRIEMLSRFLTSKENQRVLQETAKGLVDIVIGTHRLLQKDVQFKDLGLVVIDEEHRFGVVHKEKLKKLRNQVDVLSLTATPIPRTLHMSLVAIRDMSIIESPPLNRLAIQTYITRYDERVIRDAVLREIERGGQVFFLHNRVETISRIGQKIADLVPEAKVAIAHGQMRPRELEKVMLDFFDNRTQVLVCSAIIESGLDFPNANTIIINRADQFGVAQLYQLRGRVGRSHRRAYAYLLIPGEKLITRDAERRLKALQELDELGGGFKLALHDLEIRGAGNLLGEQQSGHIATVGFELYTEMMEKAIKELKGEEIQPEVEPEIKIEIPAYFPETYMPDANQRLLFYKRMASVDDVSELETLGEEIQDRFGPFSEEVKNLFLVMHLRRVLKDHLVERVTYHEGKISLLFHSQSQIQVERVMELIGKDKSRYRLAPDGRVSFAPKGKTMEEIIPELTNVLRKLCSSESGHMAGALSG
ncbi:MAG: transcription-repair coupling factor [Deltaproteobacteria bacterium]|nr:transcription-repair coupling factor [Deltaproteobacteria bacterium]